MSAPPRGRWRAPLTIAAVALLVRGALLLVAAGDEHRFFTLDAGGYVALARDLAAGYLRPESPLFAIGLTRTPVYPLFVAAVLLPTGHPAAVIAVQIVLAVMAVCLTLRLGLDLVGPKAAVLGALMLALDPVSAVYANQLQPETLFTLLVVCTWIAWVRAVGTGSPAAAAMAGLGLGLATLTRPIALYLPLVLLGWAVHARRSGRLALALLAPFLLLAGGWVVRNAILTGVPLLSTIEGVNFLSYRAAGTLARAERISIDEAREALYERLAPRLSTRANPAEVSRAQTRLALEVIRAHPWAFIETTVAGAGHLAAGNGLTALSRLSGDEDPERVEGTRKVIVAVGLSLFLAVLYAGAIRGIAVLWNEGRRPALMLLAGTIAYFVLISAGPEANTRFRVPTVPFLALLAGAGGARWLRRDAPSRTRLGET